MNGGKMLFEVIARRIQESIKHGDDSFLPPVHELARNYGAAKKTILKALHLLRERGLISSFPGSRTMIVRPQGANFSRKVLPSSAQVLCCRIKNEIVSGRWKIGVTLPKADYFRLTYRMSFDSIVAALKSLEEQRLIHKRGKKWIIGPSPSPAHSFAGASPVSESKIALVLLTGYSTWNDIVRADNNHYCSLLRSFVHEIERFGYRVAMGYIDTAATDLGIPAGKSQIREFIRQLGDRYACVFMWSKPSDGPLIHWLLQTKKPVVTFHMEPFEKYFIHAKTLFVHCKRNESEAINITLEKLSERGHRVIAVMNMDESIRNNYSFWVNQRSEAIRLAAEKYYPKLRIVSYVQKEQFWFSEEWWNKENLFEQFTRETCLRIQKDARPAENLTYRQALMRCAPSLASVIEHPDVTALIAPNDLLARLYFVWLKQAGIAVPRDLSLTGFDNDFRSHYFPLNSVDFNMSVLGYQAAHFIIGDIPVTPARDRTLSCACSFIDRGSIGIPNPMKAGG